MPLFDFACRRCGHRFEDLVRRGETGRCPKCEGSDLERLPSTFAVRSSAPVDAGPGACGSCGDPRGLGSCALD